MHTLTIYRRELASYFTQPTAYAIIVIFLALSMGLTFTYGGLIRSDNASLEWSFFFWLPWIFMLLVPAVGIRFWAEEMRSGTIELLGTLPGSTWSAIIGKFLAAATVWLLAITLTFPIWLTVNFLGEPDNLRILSSYLGSYLMILVFLAVTMLISALSRDQVVCLIGATAVCVFMVLGSHDTTVRELAKGLGGTVAEGLRSVGVWDHFRGFLRGTVRLQDVVWSVALIAVGLVGTHTVLIAKRS